jgi:hypothetical protein
MTSVLNVDTIADKEGTGPAALTKQSAAKAFGVFNMQDGNLTTDSFGISSFADRATGSLYGNYTNAMSSADHTVLGSCHATAVGSGTTANNNRIVITNADTASRYAQNGFNTSNTMLDMRYMAGVSHGDLA